MKAYEKELKRAKTIYGEGSDEYREALSTYEGMRKAVNESKAAVTELKRDLLELDVTVAGYMVDRLKNAADKLADTLTLKEKRGTRYGESDSGVREADYQEQLNNNF